MTIPRTTTAILFTSLLAVSLAVSLPTAEPARAETQDIPQWIKQVAVLWGEGLISDAEFVQALQWLVGAGIIVVPEAVQERPVENIPTVHPDAKSGKITKIVDGDTVDIDAVRYRLSLVDTPERGEPGFTEATDFLKELCPVGSTAYYDDDSIQGSDKYGRNLGVVWCEGNGYSVTAGQELYENGHLKKFYTGFCDATEAATKQWAESAGNWFYYDVCR